MASVMTTILSFLAGIIIFHLHNTLGDCGDENACCPTVNCGIRMRSYAYFGCSTSNSGKYGYIAVDGQFVLNGSWFVLPNYPNYRGLNTMILNPYKCTASGWRWFDTYISSEATQNFTDYFNYLSDGIVLLGVSFDESRKNLTSALKLLYLAGVDVTNLEVGGKYAFVLQKGYPDKTAIATEPQNCFNAELNVRVIGTKTENLEFVPN